MIPTGFENGVVWGIAILIGAVCGPFVAAAIWDRARRARRDADRLFAREIWRHEWLVDHELVLYPFLPADPESHHVAPLSGRLRETGSMIALPHGARS